MTTTTTMTTLQNNKSEQCCCDSSGGVESDGEKKGRTAHQQQSLKLWCSAQKHGKERNKPLRQWQSPTGAEAIFKAGSKKTKQEGREERMNEEAAARVSSECVAVKGRCCPSTPNFLFSSLLFVHPPFLRLPLLPLPSSPSMSLPSSSLARRCCRGAVRKPDSVGRAEGRQRS